MNDDDEKLIQGAFHALRGIDRAPPFERVARPPRRRTAAPVGVALLAAAAALVVWISMRPRAIDGGWRAPERTLAPLRAPEAGSVFAEVRVPGEEER